MVKTYKRLYQMQNTLLLCCCPLNFRIHRKKDLQGLLNWIIRYISPTENEKVLGKAFYSRDSAWHWSFQTVTDKIYRVLSIRAINLNNFTCH